MSILAIHGGAPIRTRPFPAQNAFGSEEEEAVLRVLRSGALSSYMGNATDSFYGGREIRALEAAVQEKFNVKHAVCVNSATSGLFVALGAVLGPLKFGELDFVLDANKYSPSEMPNGKAEQHYRIIDPVEVIVSPYSMTCSASLPLAWGARPVFADIDPQTYGHATRENSGHGSVEWKISEETRAILTVSLFGHPISEWFRERKEGTHTVIPVIEDAAQAIGAYEDVDGRRIYAGTAGDIGVYSLNLGKHISAGEGGIIVTDSDGHAIMCRLLMNHAEAVVHDWNRHPENRAALLHKDLSASLYGFNLRMTELTAAVARVQFSRLDWILERQRANAARLIDGICAAAPCLDPPYVREGCVHSWYVIPFRWNAERADGIDRQRFIDAVKAELTPARGREDEGVPIRCGYVDPLPSFPIFGLPEGTCPECERAQREIVIVYRLQNPHMTEEDIEDVIAAFAKCWAEKEALR